MNRYLWIWLSLSGAGLISGLIAFVIVYLPLVHVTRMIFFTTASLAVIMLLVGLVKE